MPCRRWQRTNASLQVVACRRTEAQRLQGDGGGDNAIARACAAIRCSPHTALLQPCCARPRASVLNSSCNCYGCRQARRARVGTAQPAAPSPARHVSGDLPGSPVRMTPAFGRSGAADAAATPYLHSAARRLPLKAPGQPGHPATTPGRGRSAAAPGRAAEAAAPAAAQTPAAPLLSPRLGGTARRVASARPRTRQKDVDDSGAGGGCLHAEHPQRAADLRGAGVGWHPGQPAQHTPPHGSGRSWQVPPRRSCSDCHPSWRLPACRLPRRWPRRPDASPARRWAPPRQQPTRRCSTGCWQMWRRACCTATLQVPAMCVGGGGRGAALGSGSLAALVLDCSS